MRKILFLLISITYARAQDTLETSVWNFGIQADLYFAESFFVIPMISADKNKLHLEARYLNEEVETASAWIGYNISGGSDFKYLFTPMIGGTIGRINGLAAELDLTLHFSDFELDNQLEYVLDIEDDDDVFYYSFEMSYLPLDWMWFGISGQRARAFQETLELEHGIFVGAAYKFFQFTTYFFDIGHDNSFLMLSLEVEF
jgi:hypothetical protein